MAILRRYRRVSEQIPETPLRFDVAPGTAVAHAGHTVVIVKVLEGSHVRIRAVATGAVLEVPAAEALALIDKLEQDEDVQKVFHTLA